MSKKRPNKPGPKADILKLEGDWQEAAKRLVRAKRPPEGWPKEAQKPKK